MHKTLILAILTVSLAACSRPQNGGNMEPIPFEDDMNDVEQTDVGSASDMPSDVGVRDVGQIDMMTSTDMGVDSAGPVDLGPPPNPLDGIGIVELVEEGFQFTEGPRWYPAENVLRFTDIPTNTIYELAEPNTVTVFTSNSSGANGLAFDADGNVLAAEHGGRRVSVYNGASATALIADYNGDAFNSPNDLVLRSDGTIYFTDPPYGLGGRPREINFNGLFRYDPSDQSVTAQWEGGMNTRPNGVVLSPDESVLYLADTQRSSVTAFDVASNGSLSNERAFADAANPDGMAVDVWGNIYVTSAGGVDVFAPDGSQWGTIEVPRQPANCAFGGSDAKTLYITARQGLYRVSLQVEGIY